jgi:hypothetical protein
MMKTLRQWVLKNKHLQEDDLGIDANTSQNEKLAERFYNQNTASYGNDRKDIVSLGPGIQLYFELQFRLIKVFSILSLLSMAMMAIYASFGGMEHAENQTFFHKVSFGNMGFPEAICSKAMVFADTGLVDISARCQKTTHISRISHAGILTGTSENMINKC